MSADFINAYVANLKKKVDDLLGSVVILETKLELAEQRVAQLEAEKVEAASAVKAADDAQVASMNSALEGARSEVVRLSKDCETLGLALTAERNRCSDYASTIDALRAKVDDLEMNRSNLVYAKAQLEAQIASLIETASKKPIDLPSEEPAETATEKKTRKRKD